MTYEIFSARAKAIYAEIPLAYREGVDGLEASRKTVLHPTLPEVYTLGECLSEHYPSEFGGAGEVRSVIHLYYGSFLELSRTDDEWDWEEELFETITHELRHHLEHLALDDSLGELDEVEDQNFARREGRHFDPYFFRGGRLVEPDLYEVDGDLFLERRLTAREMETGELSIELSFGPRLRLKVPTDPGDITFLVIEPPPVQVRGDFHLVLRRTRGVLGWLGDIAFARAPQVVEGVAEPVEG